MKFIEVLYKQDIDKMAEDLISTFMDDLERAAKDVKVTTAVLMALLGQCIDVMSALRAVCKSKRADSKIIRMELEVLDSGAAKFTFVPLDDDRLPVLAREDCPNLVFGPSPEDAQELMKYKKVKLFMIPEEPDDWKLES